MPSKNCQSLAKLSTATHLEKRGIERSLEKLDQSGRCTVNVLIPRSRLALLIERGGQHVYDAVDC